MDAESENRIILLSGERYVAPKQKKTLSDYIYDIGCWCIDAFFNTLTFIISNAIILVGTVVIFVFELITNIVLGALGLYLTAFVFFWIFKICWMIWAPAQYKL